jgi:hypothetical protein
MANPHEIQFEKYWRNLIAEELEKQGNIDAAHIVRNDRCKNET